MEVIPHQDLLIRLPAEEVAGAGRMLGDAIKYGYRARGWPVPPLLTEWRELLASAQFRTDGQVSGAVGSDDFRDDGSLPGLEQPPRLTVKEAALFAGVSERWIRELASKGDAFEASLRGRGYAIDIPSLNAWVRQRRKEHDKAA